MSTTICNFFKISLFTDFLHKIVQFVKYVNGEPCTVQAPNSEVVLHVPKGVYGVLLANIHTTYSNFLHLIPKSHCLISPICEYHFCPRWDKTPPSDSVHRIQVPHVLDSMKRVKGRIRVWHGNLHKNKKAMKDRAKKQERAQHYIDHQYVNILTNHFSGYIVTAECIKCCCTNAKVHLFGSLTNIPKAKPLVTVKIYLTSIHSRVKDYQMVRHLLEISILHIQTQCCFSFF